MKKMLCLLMTALVAGMLCACTAGGAAEGEGQMKNPMHKWTQEEFAQQCAQLKVPEIAPPQGAEEVQYFTYDGDLAEIQFQAEGLSYSYRASAALADVAGLYVEYEDETGTVTIGGTEAQVKSIKGGGAVALWAREGVSFSFYGKDADASRLSAVAALLV